jgi:CubicO group peptidase (beta-lactamase class C family)
MNSSKYFFVLFFCTSLLALAQKPNAQVEAQINKAGLKFLKNNNINSVSIGVYKGGQVYTAHFGELVKGSQKPPTDQTIYEVGSVTKPVTGYLVAKAVKEGNLSLEDDIRIYLKSDYPNLSFEGSPITVKHLLTHTSGLPLFLPTAMNDLFTNPKASVPQQYDKIDKAYSKKAFWEDLKGIKLSVKPGTQYNYSNTGAEIIGYILEDIYKKDFDFLVAEQFALSLALTNTGMDLNSEQKSRLAQGYWAANAQASPNQFNSLWGSGSGLKMTLPDLLVFAQSQMKQDDPIIAESQRVLFQQKTLKMSYFWRVWQDKYGTSFNHHGGTTGMQNWLFVYPDQDLAVSIITNQSDPKTPQLLGKTARKLVKELSGI